MAHQPYVNLPITDYSHHSQTTLSDMRDEVREGRKLTVDILNQMPIHFHRPDVLHMMREFSVKDILAKEGSAVVARLELSSPSPFPERSDAVLARCAAHIATIRDKSDMLLVSANALVSPDLFYIERVAGERPRLAVVRQLAEIERQCCSIRNKYERLFCSAYLSDSFYSDEDYRRMEQRIDAAFARQEEIIIALQQRI